MEELNYTIEERIALISAARKKVERILDGGLDAIINNPLSETSDYLHEKAVEQAQISIFLDSLELHQSFKDLCDIEYTSAVTNVLSDKETELAKIRHEKYAAMNNNTVSEILVSVALELLDEDEVLEVLLNV